MSGKGNEELHPPQIDGLQQIIQTTEPLAKLSDLSGHK
jgi:hypothetical protein